jgi:nucleoside-diphosphate-sugar epimerase
MKVLVLGGMGYIGSSLIGPLVQKGHEVTVLDNFYYGQYKVIDNIPYEFKLIQEDCRQYKEYKQFDIIINLAAYVGQPLCSKLDPFEVYSLNTYFTDYLCHHLVNDQLVIFPNTNSSYGKNSGICLENTLRNPLSIYADSKDRAENEVLKANGIAFRLATVCGPSPRFRRDLLVNSLCFEALYYNKVEVYEPHFRRNFINVKDVVSAIIFAIDNQQVMRGKVYNLGMDECNTTKGELAKKVCAAFGAEYIIGTGEDSDKRDYEVSSMLLAKTGFKAKITLEETIQELKEYYEYNGLKQWESNV